MKRFGACVERLPAMDVGGRARLCRDVAVRFLEGAERQGEGLEPARDLGFAIV